MEKYDFYSYESYWQDKSTSLEVGCKQPVTVPRDWNPTSIDSCGNK